MKCDICKELVYKVTLIKPEVFACRDCLSPRTEVKVGLGLKKMVKLDTMWVSENQIKEMDRRRILPYSGKDPQTYYVGRMGENGKIQEREPNFRS